MPNTPDALGPATLGFRTAQSSADDGLVLLDAEKLDCYHVALAFQVLAAALLPREERVLRDQLERASVSIVLNIAEGAGRRSRKDKARFYSIARGSAMECAAILHIVSARYPGMATECRRGRSLLIRIVQMLTKLQAALG